MEYEKCKKVNINKATWGFSKERDTAHTKEEWTRICEVGDFDTGLELTWKFRGEHEESLPQQQQRKGADVKRWGQ